MNRKDYITKEFIAEQEQLADKPTILGLRYPNASTHQVRTDLPGPFSLRLPEIYQVEVSSACNFSCGMCPRKLYKRSDENFYIPISTISKMVKRGDFDNSYFVELQMSGEPLLYPDLEEAIDLIKSTGVLVGLSTNGYLLYGETLASLDNLDYITISIDSVTQREKIRVGAKPFHEWFEEVLEPAIIYLTNNLSDVAIDLQIIELKGWEEEVIKLYKYMMPYKDRVKIRTVPDCFITKFKPSEQPNDKGMCLNPFLSVSVQSNGNVVPCCFSWGDDLIYGNINNQSMEEIWASKPVKILRENHRQGMLPEICFQCYLRSPVLLHQEIFFNSIRRNK